MDFEHTKKLAQQIRRDCVRMTTGGQSGHIGSMLSEADILAVLYDGILNVDPKDPEMPDRDRFLLSKGHAGAGVYAALSAKGFFPREWLWTYYQDNGKLSGHVSHKVPGVEFSTGSLGHGLPVAVGMALAAKHEGSKRKIYCMISDGDSDEGSTWEAFMFAGQHKLDNLCVIVDYNRIQALGFSKDIIDLESYAEKLRLFRWAVHETDGHCIEGLYNELSAFPYEEGKPSMLICRTVKGKGIPYMENTVASHYKYVPEEKLEEVLAAFGEGLEG